jgi:hypothetical protein
LSKPNQKGGKKMNPILQYWGLYSRKASWEEIDKALRKYLEQPEAYRVLNNNELTIKAFKEEFEKREYKNLGEYAEALYNRLLWNCKQYFQEDQVYFMLCDIFNLIGKEEE